MEDVTLRRKLRALWRVARYDPLLVVLIVVLSLLTAVLEGVSIGFLLPIIEQMSGGGDPNDGEFIVQAFERVYRAVGVPLTLGTLIGGVGLAMSVRYASNFAVAWLQALLGTRYVRDVMRDLYDGCLDARLAELDEHGSDELLNAVITEVGYPERILLSITSIVQQSLLCLVYVAIALYLAPTLTLAAAVVLGSLVIAVHRVVRPAYATGSRTAEANETIQQLAQSGIQGRRDVRLYRLQDRLAAAFEAATDEYTDAAVTLQRNEALLRNAYRLLSMAFILVLIYVSIVVASLSIGALAVFLFAMYRLAPRISTLNDLAYHVDGTLPHLIRLQTLRARLEANDERTAGGDTPPDDIETIRFDDVSFSYGDRPVVRNLSVTLRRPEFVAFVGESGAGKSTVASLITRLYEPDDGAILANGTSIESYDVSAWRSKIAMVHQEPYIFDETLRFNLVVGSPDATDREIERACEIAGVTEFVDQLPARYDTELGDEGIRLSGGQKQRVALARALVTDADVLVLDEATSDVDAAIEADIHAAIADAYADRLTIVIAHRLSAVSGADRIYLVDDGRIANRGTHQSLLADEGKYTELVEAQQQS
ncbi:ABC transporter ATP-binding protein [Natronococcus pandeyae]|uniref:ABC transporter ATP-binding protein n=1 Tax=Natronococcus pandeyae TaxID=2055836 RepID=A0A8J8Q5H9_9EURY|nr:ABC transporter ATP-binding protein [Natronococcus pandeyae]TYL38893.1 ABC transporter ATP-binding protein [Natronococcus pandeyae]